MTLPVPGRFLLVDHSIVRAMEKEALVKMPGGSSPATSRAQGPGCRERRHGRPLSPSLQADGGRGNRLHDERHDGRTEAEADAGRV